MKKNNHKNLKLAIIGLGYVGLPLALEFSKKRNVIGYDINKKRINALKEGKDINREFSKKKILYNKKIFFTFESNDLKNSNCYIITVPTPVKKNKLPDLTPLKNASKEVAKYLKKNDIIIYESTVYPGATEEICVPILEKYSKLKFNKDFYCGYSPERINPGDKYRKISNIKKVTSGSLPKISKLVDKLYKSIIKAGTHLVSSIKIAEAAKIIENTQRDLNIAFINELSILFKKLNLDTEEVLKAAETKWNFISFRPGLVGGHCIGVDPYYLTFKSKEAGYNPRIILAGRKINDEMPSYIVNQLLKISKSKSINIKRARILIMGLAFKENCSDVRNSLVFQMINKLNKYRCNIEVYDPYVDAKNLNVNNNFRLIKKFNKLKYDIILIPVAHEVFKKISINHLKKNCKTNHIIFDLKGIYKKSQTDFVL
jgi:UDP-N-acetyl-D-galactosamine dehydrogenase